jgi:large repetitive protein
LIAAYNDLPSNEGSWHYRVTAQDKAGNESALSDEAIVVSDKTMPAAVSITYAPHGKFDPVTGRIAPGMVDVTLTVSEPLSAVPFLTLTPTGGIPMPVELTKTTDTKYEGFFTVLNTTPSGTAYAVFSARDVAGNRGTEIRSGDRILLDTQGPAVSRLAVTPAAPIRNSSQTPVTVSVKIGLTEKTKSGLSPQLSCVLSGSGQTVAINNMTPDTPGSGEAAAFQGSFVLPAGAGAAGPETFKIAFQAADDLDNSSDSVLVNNLFQVYQGGLPPLTPPEGLTAKAGAGGIVTLAWREVEDAAAYQLYRKAPGQSTFTALAVVEGALTYTDHPSPDGTYAYAVSSIRRENGDESVGGMSAEVQVTTDSLSPQAPRNLTLDLERVKESVVKWRVGSGEWGQSLNCELAL